ncbi:MAG: hypothetical protein HLUCCA11_23025 [Phormidesmis priestleyi Ana]|uniref:Telomere resolvase ResT/TelK catalytic domain-containing protein n=1 Tax=Phormidesmis priestleyi Ana TaxID=1666911 RepID=A0A0P8BST1_9CYAN|nr:MAG: hypothetical protein HLUCCA11_23025 [Phormidesmis priestleyi Ana]
MQTDDPAKVEQLCRDEIGWLESEPYGQSTRTKFVSAYRKAVNAYFSEHSPAANLLRPRKTKAGIVNSHCALDYLWASGDDYDYVKSQNKTKTAEQRDNLTGFNAAAAVEATKQAINSEDWRELAAGLIMATQSRPSDMLSSGEFKAISKYRLEFKIRAKKRGAVATGEIFCLIEAATFIDAFSRLRRSPEVMEMKDWALKDIDSGKNSTLNRAVKRVYGEIIPVPYGESELSCKNLRAAGVNAAYWLHGRDDQSLGRFAELQLLYENPGTAANYEDFYAADAEGNRLLKVGVLKDAPLDAKPKSEKRSSVSVDAQLRDMIGNAEQWGEGSHADRLERIIARALQADKLEAQLARECEKRQALELRLKRLESATEQPTAKATVETATADDEPAGFDWRKVPNAELNGDRRHDAYDEKLRRTFEAIQNYNAGLDDSEQFAVTGSLLRQITGVKPGKVKLWIEGNKAALDNYNGGYGSRQNVGKPDPKSVIKWSEQAYGEYEW